MYEVVAGHRGFPPQSVYRGLKLVVFDVDGVLTDGAVVLGENGTELKNFDVRDGTGMGFLRYAGLKMALISGRTSAATERRAQELKIAPELVRQGVARKLPVLEELLLLCGVSPSETAFIGDDIIDVPAMESVGLALSPGDARPEAREVSHACAIAHGGKGAVRQLCEHILKRRDNGDWERAVSQYLGRSGA
jgi:3-deoxy-D-manno-octulosonate 8-phosphate phosphatase (KDO 8-P phosphatase)